MPEPKFSAKGRRHARNIERSAKRRASDVACVSGTDKLVAKSELRRILDKRVEQQARIIEKRMRRRDFQTLSASEKRTHREAGRAHKTVAEYMRAAK